MKDYGVVSLQKESERESLLREAEITTAELVNLK